MGKLEIYNTLSTPLYIYTLFLETIIFTFFRILGFFQFSQLLFYIQCFDFSAITLESLGVGRQKRISAIT